MTGTRPWWRDAVVYQIYVRSFADGDGDGIGDLVGIRHRLGHVADLGADAVWLTPCYPSPQYDHGYDVADYCDIEPTYGDLDDFDALVAEAHGLGLRVLMDVVPNHCSVEHPWFRAAVAAGRGSPERARFWFRDGRGPDGDEPPNNWQAIFGGPAWTRVAEPDGSPGQWYLHVFTPWQPDFDWSNPDVLALFGDVLRFWFDRGVDGFRVDAVTVVGKPAGLPDCPPEQRPRCYEHVPSGFAVWREWRRIVDQYERSHPGRSLTTVGEAYAGRRPDLLARYAAPDAFHQTFSFDLLLSPWEADSLRRAIDESWAVLTPLGQTCTWTLNNHDVHRVVTRLGHADAHLPETWTGDNLFHSESAVDLEVGTARARALIGATAALPGSLYLYQGEELGLPEVLDLPLEVRTDPIVARTGGAQLGRDGCRVPMPWDTDPATSYGFSASTTTSSTAVAAPWLPQPDDWGRRSVAAQADAPDSMLATYRSLLSWRRRLDPAAPFEWVGRSHGVHDDLVVFERGDVLVVLNPSGSMHRLPDGSTAGRVVVWSSRPDHDDPTQVPPDTCVWYAPADFVTPR